MHSARKLSEHHVLDIEESAKALLAKELEEFVAISMTLTRSFGFLQSRVKSKFPKDCRKCGAVYNSFEAFYYETEEIAQGTVNYPTLGSEFYVHRNCKAPCDSTLVVIFNDRRDETEMGGRRREIFRNCLQILQEHFHLPTGKSRELLFSLISRRLKRLSETRKFNPESV